MVRVYVARKVDVGTIESRSRHFLPPIIVVEEKGRISSKRLEKVLGERVQSLLGRGKLNVRDEEKAKKILSMLSEKSLEKEGEFVELMLVVENAK